MDRNEVIKKNETIFAIIVVNFLDNIMLKIVEAIGKTDQEKPKG